ncbi:MAG: CopD family protein [Dehalococcoidia bacterium]|jgi:uncharacterized membrane protein|nr:CopD family protein [Dehalococcoidia bacterium]MDW8008884.1 CopD family protein [Chloroflexota bacterium]
MTESISFWIHIVAATAFIGPQFLLFLVIPALRTLEPGARARVLRVLTSRFGWLGGAAIVVLVLSGLSNLFQRMDEIDDLLDPGRRYAWIFTAKMGLLALALVLTALHSFVVGPRQLQAMEAGGSDAQARSLRRATMALSALILLASLGIVFAAALMADHSFSLQPV